jgi:2,3-bisphosphoglycerate-independent phosphoglycerate mutase
MSAYEVTDKLLSNIGEYDFILVNYANPDLVGHSGVFDAVVKACEVVDECTDKVIKKALEEDYVVFLTADHGNSECMVIDGKEPDPSHGYNSVLFTLISNDEKLKNVKLKNNKGQKDVAPTILDIMNIKKPKEMTGESLIIN